MRAAAASRPCPFHTGLHAADLIQECANAKAAGTTVRDLAFTTHTHPTLSEVIDGAFKECVGMHSH